MVERPDLSIVAPMYNELENIASTIEKITRAMEGFAGTWELIIVNDGSNDGSFEKAAECAADLNNVHVTGYEQNRGRGAALRTGFQAARARIVATVDFDLSYSPDHILRMYRLLMERGDVDVVMASAYMPGGSVQGVPWGRLAVSRLGNLVLRAAFRGAFHTTTCIVRAYRREVLEALPLESDRKEIHLEILSKALTLGFKVVEMPATLKARARGAAKFAFLRTSMTHLFFAVAERPTLLGAGLGALILVVTALNCIWVAGGWRGKALEASGHLLLAAGSLVAGAAVAAAVWLIGALISRQRQALTRVQSRVTFLERQSQSTRDDGEQ